MKSGEKLRGAVVPIGTPLADGDRVDEPGLRRLVRYLLTAGVHGLLANGSMGGFAFLTDEEQVRAVSIVLDEVAGAVPVTVGLGDTSTSRAVRQARQLAMSGVHSLSVLAPFYFFATQANLIAYFSDIAAAVDCPLFLYDNPKLTKNPIHPDTISAIRQRVPQVVGIKESNQDLAQLQRLIFCFRTDPGFSILAGTEFLILAALQMGCDGFIGGLHNICPAIAVRLYESFMAEDLAEARRLQQELITVFQILQVGDIWGGFDEALRQLGICERATGQPYVSRLTPAETARVQQILDQHVRPYLARGKNR